MIECVPNVSEGRDPGAVSRMESAVRAAGSSLLDVHQDPDHNRSVLTFVSDRDAILRSVLALIGAATEQIDVRSHEGVHPRMGAVDVIPFVPLDGTTMNECIQLANQAGRAIADKFAIPVYLYEHAATRPQRRNLAGIRRGGLSGIAERIRAAEWRPDFGPARVHPTAGAVAVGARLPLVAFNVVLDTDDVGVALEIAGRIRAKDGGLAGVKALGLLLPSRGLAQVSMNLTDIETTNVRRAFDAVASAAERQGATIRESEIVGLAPRAALDGATTENIRLTRDLADVILEDRISAS